MFFEFLFSAFCAPDANIAGFAERRARGAFSRFFSGAFFFPDAAVAHLTIAVAERNASSSFWKAKKPAGEMLTFDEIPGTRMRVLGSARRGSFRAFLALLMRIAGRE